MNNEHVPHNNITLQSYEQGVSEYISGTAAETNGSIKAWIDNFLDLLPLNAHIIEIGSAFGRDAQYIESCGFSVKRTDATIGFVKRSFSVSFLLDTGEMNIDCSIDIKGDM